MKKQKVSLSLREDIIKKIDKYADGINFSSRSHVIEKFLENYLSQNRFCVILAGGNPKNLWVKETGTYRPLVKVNNVTLIEHIIKKTVEINYKNIIVVGSKEINTAIFNEIENGSRLDCNIIYIEEKEFKNTANTLRSAKKYLKDTFLIIPCDHYFDFDLRKLENIHRANDFTMTLAVYGGAKFSWSKTAMVELDGNDIIKYWVYPKTKETNLISTLIGFAEPDIFSLISDKTSSLQNEVSIGLIKERKLGGVLLSGNFVNVHTKQDVMLIEKLSRGDKK